MYTLYKYMLQNVLYLSTKQIIKKEMKISMDISPIHKSMEMLYVVYYLQRDILNKSRKAR